MAPNAQKEERLKHLKLLSSSAHEAERTNRLDDAYRLHNEAHTEWKRLKEDSTWWSTNQREDKRHADFLMIIHHERITAVFPYINGKTLNTPLKPLPSYASANALVVTPTQLITPQMTTEEQQLATLSNAISGVSFSYRQTTTQHS
jgi:hypothetical protein